MKKGKQRKNEGHRKEGSRKDTALATLAPFLDQLAAQYQTAHWLSSDPVQFAHRYPDPADREVVAMLSTCFAYGSVKLIHRAVERVLAPMGEHPASFCRGFSISPGALAAKTNPWSGFYHRFHHEEHAVVLVAVLGEVLREHGSLAAFFRRHARSVPAGTTDGRRLCERMLDGAVLDLHDRIEMVCGCLARPDLIRGVKFFFNAPSGKSACKRMVMFLRWMARSDEVDLGLWEWFPTGELVMPVDTHVGRISFYLGLRGGKEAAAPNWKMALEITDNLRKIRPADPVAYDFALARLGILDICQRRYERSVCERCAVQACCRYSTLRDRSARNMLTTQR